MRKNPGKKFLRQIVEFLLKIFTEETRKISEEMGEHDKDRIFREVFERDTADSEVTKEELQHDRGTSALTAAFSRRWRTYFPIFIIPLLIATIGWYWFDQNNLNAYSAFYQIFGAIIVARGILRDPREIDRNSMMVFPVGGPTDSSERFLASFETIDAMFGIAFLVLGYTVWLFDAEGLSMTFIVIFGVILAWWATTETISK